MSIQVTSLSLQAISDAPGLVVPKTLPAETPRFIRANWRTNIRMTSAWRTDVVGSMTIASETRRALLDRPQRTIEMMLSGLSSDEAQEILGAVSLAGSSPVPVPLHQDETVTTAPSAVVGGYYFFTCPTDYRRLFPGARILIVSSSYTPSLQGGHFYKTIRRVFSNGIEIAESLPGVLGAGTRIYPCLDCTVSPSTRGSAQTDATYEVSFTATEEPGPSALPALWVGGAHPFFRRWIKSNFPFGALSSDTDPPSLAFDALPNWLDGIDIDFERDGSLIATGKGLTAEWHGTKARAVVSMPFLQRDRRESWILLSLFDALRGREGTAFVHSPVSGLRIHSVDSNTQLTVAHAGSSSDLSRVPYLAIFYRPADGPIIGPSYLKIQSVTPTAVGSVVTLDPATNVDSVSILTLVSALGLPEIVAAFETRLASDEISEEWITDQVMQTSLTFTEVLFETPDIEVLDAPPRTNFQGSKAFDVPDLLCAFEAGKNCFWAHPDGTWRRAEHYPTKPRRIARIFDARLDLPDVLSPSLAELSAEGRDKFLQENPASSVGMRALRASSSSWINQGNSTIINPAVTPGWLDPTLSAIAQKGISGNLPWSSLGMTIFLVVIGGARAVVSGVEEHVLRIFDGSGNLLLDWVESGVLTAASQEPVRGRVRVHRAPGVFTSGDEIFPRHMQRSTEICAVIRWTPGGKLEAWHSGDRYGEAGLWQSANNIPSIAVPTTIRNSDVWLNAFNYAVQNQPSPGFIDSQYGTVNLFNALSFYRRALTLAEINTIGAEFASRYNFRWIDV